MHTKKLYNQDEMDKLLEKHKLLGLKFEEIKNPNRTKNHKHIESIIKTFPTKKSLGRVNFTGEFYQTLKEELKLIFTKLFKKFEKGILLDSFCEASITQISNQAKYITRIKKKNIQKKPPTKSQNPKLQTNVHY